MGKPILVVGVTGKVGKALAEVLVAKGQSVRGTARDPEAARKKVTLPGLELAALDFEKPSGWATALEGVARMFLQSRPGEATPEEILVPLIDQAREAGVERVVLMTALNVDRSEELGLRKVERHLMGSGLRYTILRPNWFMQNFSEGFIGDGIRHQGGIYLPAADARVSFIDTRDIAAVAAKALLEEGHDRQEYALTGSQALGYAEAARVISDLGCRQVPYVAVSEEAARQGLLQAGWEESQAGFMLALFAMKRKGFAAPVENTVERLLGRPPIDFQSFVRDFRSSFC
ncbi:MAG TPA: SDR family oxidoreductase [Myxococcota bacterium]|nr:SDR family oxidoreductase [Myxococcota bacterium]HRY92982.1 SDR family oxidoreductase [Myxococcota bacterium]HSA19909.1 SDR family oxidoreductase [Myxococcota bacterium]